MACTIFLRWPAHYGVLQWKKALSGRKNKLKLKYVVLSVAVVLIIAGAYFVTRPAPPALTPPKVLTIGMGTEPPILDPHRASGMPNLGILRLVMETPLDIHYETGQVLPCLVERWEASPDATTWTLYLRRNVKFHDGTPFNATAIKFTFERLLDPETKAGSRSYWFAIKSVEVKDTYTAVIRTSPNAPFLRKLNYGPCEIVSPSQVKRLGDKFAQTTELPVGTGPYRFAEYVKGSHIKLVANNEYWGGRPKIDTIIVKPIPEAGARLMALEAGTVDFVYSVPPADIPRLEKNSDLRLVYGKPTRTMWLALNNKWGPLQDKRVRQALNYAVDKVTMNERIFKGKADVMDCIMPSHAVGYYKVGPYPYDPAKAKQLLKEAGFPEGFEVTLRYSPGRYLMSDEIAGAIQSYLAAVGVKVKIETLDWAALSTKNTLPLDRNDNQMVYLGAGLVSLDFDDLSFMTKAGWPPSNLFPVFYENARFDKLYEQGAVVADTEERMKSYREANQILWDDAPVVFLWFEPQIYAARKRAHEIYVRHEETIWLKDAWVESEGGQRSLSIIPVLNSYALLGRAYESIPNLKT